MWDLQETVLKKDKGITNLHSKKLTKDIQQNLQTIFGI